MVKGDRSTRVDDTPKGVVMMANHEVKLGKEERRQSERVIVKMW